MNTEFRKSFTKDLRKKAKDRQLLERIRFVVLQVEEAENVHEISNIKKLTAEGEFYRIRVGDYRIGLVIEDDTARFVRMLHRREIYRYFP